MVKIRNFHVHALIHIYRISEKESTPKILCENRRSPNIEQTHYTAGLPCRQKGHIHNRKQANKNRKGK